VVVIDESGQIDWTLRANSPFDPGNVRIENLVVEGGQFDVIDRAAGRTHSIILPKATVSAKALTGPWRLNGEAQINGEAMHLAVSTGQSEKGVLPLRITALPTAGSVVIESDGSAKFDGSRASYAGQFVLRPALKSDFELAKLKVPNAASDEAAAAQFKVSGKFGLAPTGLALPEFKLETGDKANPYVANGSGSIIFGAAPMFDLKLVGTQVNIKDDKGARAGSGLTNRIETFRQFVTSLPMPDMPGVVSVNLPAIVAGDTTIRDIAFEATPESGAWRVRNFKSTLPGRTQVEADGLLRQGDAFGFAGRLLVASNQPAGLANWLTGQVDPAIRKLNAVGFSADVDLKPDVQSFENLELALGAASFKGKADRRTDGERPALGLSLTGGALDLDGLNALGIGFLGEDGQNRFSGHDISLNLDVGPVSQGGIEAKKLGASLRIKANLIEIDRLMVTDVAGVSISATGQLTDPGSAVSGNLDASLISADASAFTTMLAQSFPGNATLQTLAARVSTVPEILKDLNATMIVSTAKDADERAMTVSLNAKTSTGELVFAGNGKGMNFTDLTGSFQASLREDDPLALVALAGIPVVPLGAPGPVVLDVTGAGDFASGLDTSVKINAAGTNGSFSGQLKSGDNGLEAKGRIALESDDFDPYLAASGLVFSSVGTGTPLAFKSNLKTESGLMAFSAIDGAVRDNRLKGDLTLKLAERPTISGAVGVDHVDVFWLAENLFGTGNFDALSGPSAVSAFSTQPVTPFDGSVELSVAELALGPAGLASNAKVKLDMTNNALRLNELTATLYDGALSCTLDMRNDGGAGAVSADFSLQGATAQEVGFMPALSGQIDFSGSVTSAAKSMEGLVSEMTGSGVVSIREGVVSGFDPDAFPAIIAQSAATETAPLLSDVEKMIASSVTAKSFPLNTGQLAWSVAGGKMRLPGIKGDQPGAIFTADASGNLLEGSASVNGSITYNAGTDGVIGAEPTVPFVASVTQDTTSFETDAQPLLQFLTQRALEREQARVEALQSALVEKQRLRRDVRLIGMLYAERDRRALLRETAVRTEAARLAATLSAQWEREKAKQEEKRLLLEAEAKAAAEKAAADAAKVQLDNQLEPQQPEVPANQNLDDVFQSLDFDVN
ncbi:MAG: AsmA-like C-terminal region-containing protein, partial [Rhizobiaceae bacterium]